MSACCPYIAGVRARSPLKQYGIWGDIIRSWLHEVLPGHAAELCSNRVNLLITRMPWLVAQSINQFTSKADLIDVILASAHVPFILDGKLQTRVRGVPCIDGNFWYTVKQAYDIYEPTDGSTAVLIEPKQDTQLLTRYGNNTGHAALP